jgi:hypothetical protein
MLVAFLPRMPEQAVKARQKYIFGIFEGGGVAAAGVVLRDQLSQPRNSTRSLLDVSLEAIRKGNLSSLVATGSRHLKCISINARDAESRGFTPAWAG